MSDINNCTFSGRLTRDAERKIISTGTTLVTFDMANNTGFGENAKVMYVTVNMWGKSGENVFQYLQKGKAVGVCGKLEMQRWKSKHDDSNQSKLVLTCSELTFLGSANKDNAARPAQDDGIRAEPIEDSGESQSDIPF